MRLFALFLLLCGALPQADLMTLVQVPVMTEQQLEMLRNPSHKQREVIPRRLSIEAVTAFKFNLAISAAAVNSF